MEKYVAFFVKVSLQIKVLKLPSEHRLDLRGSSLFSHLQSFVFLLLVHKHSCYEFLVGVENPLFFVLQHFKNRWNQLCFWQKFYNRRLVCWRLPFHGPLTYFVDNCFWKFKQFFFLGLQNKFDVYRSDFKTGIKEVVPDILCLSELILLRLVLKVFLRLLHKFNLLFLTAL